ncbi:MAG TPA: hypothetical protein P5080_03700 [Candidatus Paceibacterota bacterium]|nr:hypothetical protein [Candidatus Pacearchaeota archaeon]HRZ51052.1 hypothetical protein [Candidatus Paceibacterota bacterium]HSA36789.1 hypothetical protein [Candidatus Paceibacterota bacterium]
MIEIEDKISQTLAQRIATILRENLTAGFEIIPSDSTNSVGIIYAAGQGLKVFRAALKKAERYYFGTIFTEPIGLGQSPIYAHTKEADSTHWIFTVFGRNNIETAKGLAKILAEEFPGISVKIILSSEKPEKQENLTDWSI